MSHKNAKSTPSWQLNAIHGAMALMFASTVFVPNAMAQSLLTGTAVISTDQTNQSLRADDDSKTTVNVGVSVTETSGTALLYPFIPVPSFFSISPLITSGSSSGYSTSGAGNIGNLAGSLTNHGTISSNGYGSSSNPIVGVKIENALTGTLTNTVTIEAISNNTYGSDAYAFGVRVNSTMSGTINNSGSIIASTTVSGSGGSVSAVAYGVYLSNGLDGSGSLTNSGNISAIANNSASADGDSAEARAYGVYIGSGLLGTLTNSGSISASATFTGSNSSSSAVAFAQGIRIGDLSGSLSNSGSVTATANNSGQSNDSSVEATAYGIYVGGMSGTLTNSGTITASAINSGTAANSSLTAYADGVSVNGVLSGALTNSGTISATASVTGTSYNGGNASANGVKVGTVDPTGVVTNSGTITATATAAGHHNSEMGSYAFAAGLNISSLSGVVNNSGTISGVVTADPSQGYSIWVDGGSAFARILSSTGGGTINNLAGGLLDGNINVSDSGVTVNNAGTIRIPVGVQGYIAGTYNQSATGVLAITAIDTSNYSQLHVAGTATLDPGASIYVSALDGTHTLAKGEILDSVLSAETLESSTVNVTDNSLLFNFSPIITNGETGHIDLQIESGTSVVTAVTNNLNFGGLGAAGLLDNLIANGSPGMSGVIGTLGGLGTEREVSDAVRQMLPLVTTGTTGAIRDGMSGINRVIQARVDANHGLSAGDNFVTNRNIWLKPVGAWADQKDRNGVSGYSADAAGVVIGADGAISDKSRVGGALAIMRSNVDSNASGAAGSQSATIDGYQAVVYGSYSLDNRTDINWQADVGLNQTKGTRNLPLFAAVAKSDYDSTSTHIGAGVGRIYDLSPKTTFTPSVRADYTSIRDKGYLETGAGALNLNVDANTTDEFILSVDGKWIHKYSDQTKVMANFGVGYDTMADQASITSSFVGGGAAFATKGVDQSAWLVRAGLGLVMTTSSAMEITARYDLEARQDSKNQTLSVKFRMPF